MGDDPAASTSFPNRGLAGRARTAFVRRFGGLPTWTAAAPGRVNLIGEHVDYCGGLVLPMAIDRWALAAAAPARGEEPRLFAVDFDRWEPVGDDARGALASVLRRFPAGSGGLPPLDIAITSDVPRAAGLSSSAAVEVAMATVLEAVTGRRLDDRAKAELCRQAEHDAGVPCGIMDMYVAVRAEPDCALLIDCETLETRAIALPPADRVAVIVVDTGVDRTLASTAYADRRAACSRGAAALGVPSLRHADRAMLDRAALSAEDRRRARHVIDEIERTKMAVISLERDDLAGFGNLLFASHDSLRDLYEVSCAELDTIVASARELRKSGAGVLGARMTGAGFGGCAIVMCAAEAVAPVATGIRAAFRTAHGREVEPFVVRAVGGAVALG